MEPMNDYREWTVMFLGAGAEPKEIRVAMDGTLRFSRFSLLIKEQAEMDKQRIERHPSYEGLKAWAYDPTLRVVTEAEFRRQVNAWLTAYLGAQMMWVAGIYNEITGEMFGVFHVKDGKEPHWFRVMGVGTRWQTREEAEAAIASIGIEEGSVDLLILTQSEFTRLSKASRIAREMTRE